MPPDHHFLSLLTGSFASPADENPTVAMIEAAYCALGLDARYINCDVPPALLGDAVRGARAMGWAGFNCSIPHKMTVIEHLDALITQHGGAQAEAVHWMPGQRIDAGTDIVVNATSIGLFPDVAAMPDLAIDSLQPGMVVADVIPNPPRTALIEAAAQRGCVTLDGLGMLVNQGLISITHWTGRSADAAVMRATLERLFGG